MPQTSKVAAHHPYPLWAKLLLSTLVIACITFIFTFSTQTGNQSSSLSWKIASFLAGRPLPSGTLLELAIRKLAHLSEYLLLGLLMSACLRSFLPKCGKRVILLFITGLVLASIDETIQSFTPGRTPAVTDVLIDFTGAALGVGIFFGIRALYNKQHNKKQVQSN